MTGSILPPARSVLAVCAHPDDETFGLGAVIDAYVRSGARVSLLVCTAGEASTLGTHAGDGSLGARRLDELRRAVRSLGIERLELCGYPDGRLADVRPQHLADRVRTVARGVDADVLLVFDEGGVTGHPDHVAATRAAVAAADADDLDVFAWTVPEEVAARLNAEFGTTFVGRPPSEVDLLLEVDRGRQRDAIACHVSQSEDNPVLRRRLELTGSVEPLRSLRRSARDTTDQRQQHG